MKKYQMTILLAGFLSVGLFSTGAYAQSPTSNVISTATTLVGSPYQWGGTKPSGFDCSGFVKYVYEKYGASLPHSSKEMYKLGQTVTTPQPGDLVFFHTYNAGPSHVGIYLGDNKFISATDDGVEIRSLKNSYWASRYLGARSI